MPSYSTDTFVFLVVLVLACLVAMIYLLLRWRQMRIEHQRYVDISQGIVKDQRALVQAALQVGERVRSIEQKLSQLQQRQESLGQRQEQLAHSAAAEPGYEQAIKLAGRGASVAELMEVCDITQGEAELIAMMNRLEGPPEG